MPPHAGPTRTTWASLGTALLAGHAERTGSRAIGVGAAAYAGADAVAWRCTRTALIITSLPSTTASWYIRTLAVLRDAQLSYDALPGISSPPTATRRTTCHRLPVPRHCYTLPHHTALRYRRTLPPDIGRGQDVGRTYLLLVPSDTMVSLLKRRLYASTPRYTNCTRCTAYPSPAPTT